MAQKKSSEKLDTISGHFGKCQEKKRESVA
jgi:hypothetical protein